MIHNGIKTRKIKTQVCIIGSGIGGGTLAKYLEKSRFNVAIVEAGELHKHSDNVSYENVGHDFGVRTTTCIQVGGTSNLWHGVLSPLDSIDFVEREWLAFSGWPINFSDIEPFYNQAAKFLNVEKPNYFCSSKLSSKMKIQLQDMEFPQNYLKQKVFQQPIPTVNFKNVVINLCKNNHSCHLYYNSPALELISKGNKIVSVVVGNPDGSTSLIEADVFIVSAGALETPRLLLNSKIENDNIGRFLMDHPMGNLCQMEFNYPKKIPIYTDLKYSKKMKLKVGFEFLENIQKDLKLPNHCFFIRPSFIKGINNASEKVKMSLLSFKDGKTSLSDMLSVLKNPNVVRQILSYKFSLDVTVKYADLFFVTEQLPNPDSRVTLSENRDLWGYHRSKVDWQISNEEIKTMRRIFDLLRTKLFVEPDYTFTHGNRDFNWDDIFTSAVHHVGTARMGRNKDLSVVDKNLRSLDRQNLYVCDGSVFTTAGNVNNGLTISALAIRLANYLTYK